MDKRFEDHGLLSWAELLTSDFEGSFAFYSELFGWSLQEVPGRGESRYALILNENSSEPFAGILAMPKPLSDRSVPCHWQTYITVENVETTVEKAQALGAVVVLGPMEIERVGTIAAIRDPQGAVISVIKYSQKTRS